MAFFRCANAALNALSEFSILALWSAIGSAYAREDTQSASKLDNITVVDLTPNIARIRAKFIPAEMWVNQTTRTGSSDRASPFKEEI